MIKSREEDQRLFAIYFAVLSGGIINESLRKVTSMRPELSLTLAKCLFNARRFAAPRRRTRREGCHACTAVLFFSVIPHYLSVASGQEIFPAQRSARGFIFSRYPREIRSSERQKERVRDRTGRGAHAEFKRRDIFMRLSFMPGDERFSPRIISIDIFFALGCHANSFFFSLFLETELERDQEAVKVKQYRWNRLIE